MVILELAGGRETSDYRKRIGFLTKKIGFKVGMTDMALERIVIVYRLDSQISWDDILTSFFFFFWLVVLEKVP